MNRLGTAFAGIVLIVLPWFLGSPVRLYSDWRASSGWSKVEATVKSVRAINFDKDGKRQSWGDDPQYEAEVEYEYAGKRLTRALRLEPTLSVSFVGRDAPKAGDRLEVLVNPARPEEIYRGRGEILVLALFMAAAIPGGLYLVFRALRGPVDDLAD